MSRKTSAPTIVDVAREAGVSISIVSRILNESPLVADETLGKVRGAIQRLGYLPHSAARNLALRRTNTLGILIESVGSSFFASVVAGAEEATDADGFSLLIATPEHLLKGKRPALGPFNTDGLLIVGVQLKIDLFSFYPDSYPIINLYQPAPRSLRIPLVSVENKKSAFKVVEHLIREHGMSRIAYLRGPKGNYDSCWREAGYRQAMKEYGLAVDRHLIGDGGFTYPGARATVQRWVAEGRLPQAIFAGNDDAALDVIMTFYGAGVRVPQDVAVVGFDDSLLAPNMVPPLTTVRAPGVDVGREAVRQLLHLIHTGKSTPLTLLPTELVVSAYLSDNYVIQKAWTQKLEERTKSDPYSKGLMGSIIVPEKGLRDVKLAAIPGVPPNLKKPPAGCRFAERCKYVRSECKAISVTLRELEDGRSYRCIFSENELREAYKNA